MDEWDRWDQLREPIYPSSFILYPFLPDATTICEPDSPMPDLTGIHVLLVPSWWPSPEQPISGIFFADYARAYAAAGAKVGVVFPDLVSLRYLGRGTRIPWVPRLLHEDLTGVPVVRVRGLHTAFGRPALQMHRYRCWLRRGLQAYSARHGSPDILHAMCAIPAGWACTHLQDPLAARVVVTEHTGPFSLVLGPRAGEEYVRAALAKAVTVAAVSEPLRQDMLAASIARDIEVIPNPVVGDFAATAPPPVARDDRGRSIHRAIFVGRLTELKGIRELIEAALRLARQDRSLIHWHVAGYGPLESEMRDRFAAAGIGDRLILHGLCDKPTVARLVRESHFLVLPSHGENCPLAICEALSIGRPVVATDVPGCKALVGEGDGVLARVRDAASLAETIGRLVAEYERWDWRAVAARAGERFSGPAVAGQYADLFRRVLNGNTGRSGDACVE